MFKLKVQVKLKQRLEGRCPRHPGYNPVKDERDGIKGNCKTCDELNEAYQAYLELRKAVSIYEEKARAFVKVTGRARSTVLPTNSKTNVRIPAEAKNV